MTRRDLIPHGLLMCTALLQAAACGPAPCPTWQPPLVVALPDPASRAPADAQTKAQRCTDWNTVRGNSRRTGRSFCPGLRRPPEVRWSFDTGAAVTASPIVAGRWVYVGSTNGRLFALSRATGKPRWSFDTGSTIRAAVALQGNTLLLGTVDGKLRRLDARTGRVRWTHQSRHRIGRAPMVYGNVVIVTTGDGALTALDRRTGLYRWQLLTRGAWHPSHKGGYVLAGIGGPPALHGDTLYFGSLGGQVHALAAKTGKLRWGIRTGWAIRSPPVATLGGLWVSDASGYLHALSRINGDRMGSGIHSWYDRDISAPTLGDGGLYVATRTALLAVESTGYVRWKVALGWGRNLQPRAPLGAPVLAGDVVYLSDRQGRLLALDAHSGKHLWQRRAGRGAFTAPVPMREGVLVGSGDGRITLLGRPTGDR